MTRLRGPRAISPVVGVILMVAIVVVLAAVIAVFTLNLGALTQSPPQAGIQVDDNAGYADINLVSKSNADHVVVESGDTRYFVENTGEQVRVPLLGDSITVSAEKNGRRTLLAEADGTTIETNLLDNPSFDADSECAEEPTGWTYQHTSGHNSFRVVDRAGADGGTAFGNTWNARLCPTEESPSTYGDNDAIVYQDVTGVAGETLAAKARISVQTNGGSRTTPCSGDDAFIYEDDARLQIIAYNDEGDLIKEHTGRWGGQLTEGMDDRDRKWVTIGTVFETPDSAETVRLKIQGGDGNSTCIGHGNGGNAGIFIDTVEFGPLR